VDAETGFCRLALSFSNQHSSHTQQDIMKKNRPAIPKGAPKSGDARAPKAPIWAPRQSKAPQTHVKPRDTSQKSGQRGR